MDREQEHVIKTTLSSDVIVSTFLSNDPAPPLKMLAELTSEMSVTIPILTQSTEPSSESILTRCQNLKPVFYCDFRTKVVQYTKSNYVVQEE
jgi:hypothetical protein